MPPRPGAVAAAAAEVPALLEEALLEEALFDEALFDEALFDEALFDETLFDEAAFVPRVSGPWDLVVCGLVTDCCGAVAIADQLSTSGLVSVCSTVPDAVLPADDSREISMLLPLAAVSLVPLLTLAVLVVSGAAAVATLAAVAPAEPGAAQARVAELTAT
jgi:hypothetical protein